MKCWTAAIALLSGAASLPAQTTPNPAPFIAPVQAFARVLNEYRAELPGGIFTDSVVIIDDFAPFAWSGHGAAADWYAGLVGRTPEERAKTGIRAIQAHLTLGSPQQLIVDGDRAYFVLPATFTTVEATVHKTQHARWVIVESRVNGTWLINAHGWGIVDTSP